MDNNYLVDIQHERLSFFTPAGEVKALNDVSIHLKEGEVLGIVGESGSGKSVTAYSLMGLTAYPGKLIGGELHFNGHEVEKMTEKDFSKMRGKEVSIIFQDPLTSLNPVYTIGNQRCWSSANACDSRAVSCNIRNSLSQTGEHRREAGLPPHRPAHTYPCGSLPYAGR